MMPDAGNTTEPQQGQKRFVFHFLAHCDFCGCFFRTTAEITILDKNKQTELDVRCFLDLLFYSGINF